MLDYDANIGTAGTESQPGTSFHDSETASVINQAALLDDANYELQRAELARVAGMRLGTLDRARKARRKEIADEGQAADAVAPEGRRKPTLEERMAAFTATVDRLARLGNDEYQLCRKDEARAAGVMLAHLDSSRAKRRRELVEQGELPSSAVGLNHGSDVEIAQHIVAELHEKKIEMPYAEGRFWRWRQEPATTDERGRKDAPAVAHWEESNDAQMHQAVQKYDGMVAEQGRVVSLNDARNVSIIKQQAHCLAQPDFFLASAPGINFANCFVAFDLETGKPQQHTHDKAFRQRHTLPAEWEPFDSYRLPRDLGEPGWWRCMLSEDDLLYTLVTGPFKDDPDAEQKISTLFEFMGSAAAGIANNSVIADPLALILHGVFAQNGKSQLLDLARGTVAPGALCAIPPSDLARPEFAHLLIGKLLNATDELSTAHAITGDKFKNAITGEPMTAKALYNMPASFRPRAQHMYGANVLPSFKGGMDRGVQRRLFVMPFLRTIPPEERKWGSQFGQFVVRREADKLLRLAVQGASRVIQRRGFDQPEWARNALNKWATQADPALAWCADCVEYAKGQIIPNNVAYASFVTYAKEVGYNTIPDHHTWVQRIEGELQKRKIGYGPRNSVRGLLDAKLAPRPPEEYAAFAQRLAQMSNARAQMRAGWSKGDEAWVEREMPGRAGFPVIEGGKGGKSPA